MCFFCLPSIRALPTRPVYPGMRATGKIDDIVDFISDHNLLMCGPDSL